MNETISISREEYDLMKQELESVRNTQFYRRLLEFEKNIQYISFTRKDLSF